MFKLMFFLLLLHRLEQKTDLKVNAVPLVLVSHSQSLSLIKFSTRAAVERREYRSCGQVRVQISILYLFLDGRNVKKWIFGTRTIDNTNFDS
jgi:hypothetical protein